MSIAPPLFLYWIEPQADVSLGPGAEAAQDELVEFCRGQMAAYPPRIHVLPELPKTPTGKLLRRESREHARDSEG